MCYSKGVGSCWSVGVVEINSKMAKIKGNLSKEKGV